ncbi:MAG: PEP/pyruvate-binding domain-containing protein [Thermodesulfobacteriota bacterium]
MGFISKILSHRFPWRRRQRVFDAEGERTVLRLRYNRFKRLLNANDKVLAAMTEIEFALKGSRLFGMDFVRSRTTVISTGVYQAVKYLNDLADDGKFKLLFDKFDEIRQKITPVLNNSQNAAEAPLVLTLSNVGRKDIDQVGVKMANLGEAARGLGMGIPEGFVITSASYQAFMEHNGLKRELERRRQADEGGGLDALYRLSSSLQQLIIDAQVPEAVSNAVHEAIEGLRASPTEPLTLAVRSSGVSEDLKEASFAGQYRSVLNVSPENLLRAFKEIVASKYSATAMSYRFNRGLRDEDAVMCVGCLKMVDAVAGGVAYSRDPVEGRGEMIIINSAWGLPKLVVDGRSDVDRFVVLRSPELKIIHREIAHKTIKYTCHSAEGVFREDLAEGERLKPSITDTQVLTLARAAVAAETHYGEAQDMEWAINHDNRVVILQSRPLRLAAGPEKGPAVSSDGGVVKAPVLLQGGRGVSAGVAAGPVHILKKDVDILRFPQKAVMVVMHPLPKWAVLMGTCSAVIAEYGSITSHLASVAREFNKPAVFGLRGACDKLTDGQMVTVDGSGACIYDGEIVELIESNVETEASIAHTPVYQALERIASHVLPLTLKDPDAPDFRPENCTTFHDIIRYCHENAVREMFRFSSRYPFPRHAAKQLVCDIPMQWWVLNLDDGFDKEIEGPEVHIDDIISVPMRALWEGITMVPWEGPPPIDGKGLMSVMFEATKNTSLVTGVRSNYAERNYFMIAEHYCSLTSRFGFHFASVESYVGERIPENYIHFRFKGGAADESRKKRRVQLIEEILTDLGFSLDVNEDLLWARFEDEPMEVMQQRLRIIGFLIIHTRQLDMVMSNEKMVFHYRNRIRGTINELFNLH